MPDYMKIPRQMKEFSIQALDSVRSVCMTVICYSGPILAVPINEQLLSEKRTGAKSTQLIMLIIYVYIL